MSLFGEGPEIIDLAERVKNMTPGQTEDVQAIIVDTLRQEAFRLMQEAKYEDVLRPHLVRNELPMRGHYQMTNITRRALGLKLGTHYEIELPHKLSQEKILYYTGVDHTRLVEENYAKNPWPNVGTVGHCDWNPYSPRGLYVKLTPLQQAIKEAYVGPYQRST